MISKAYFFLILSILLIFWSSVTAAKGYCIEQWACVDIRGSETNPDFYLVNKKPFPITMTLLVSAKNMRSDNRVARKYTETMVLKGNNRVKVLSLKPNNTNRNTDYNYEFEWALGDMNAEHNDSYVYTLPFNRESKYRLVQGFNGGFSHTGSSRYAVDFAMPVGTPVLAARDGIVMDVVEKHNRGGSSRRYARYANYVVVIHNDGTTGEYYHLRKNGAAVDVGDVVQAGDLIGYSGNTGFSSLPHLHFAVYKAKSHGKFQSVPFRFEGDEQRRSRYRYGSR